MKSSISLSMFYHCHCHSLIRVVINRLFIMLWIETDRQTDRQTDPERGEMNEIIESVTERENRMKRVCERKNVRDVWTEECNRIRQQGQRGR